MEYSLLVMIIKELVILPFQEIKLELKDEISKNIIKISSRKYNNRVLVVAPKNNEIEDLPIVGVVAYIKNTLELSNGNIRVTLRGEERVRILNYESFNETIINANITDIVLPKLDNNNEIVIIKKLKESITKYIDSDPSISNSILKTINDSEDLNFLTDVIVTFLPLKFIQKLEYMQEINYEKRAYALIEDINLEIEYILLDNKIDSDLNLKLSKEQEEYYLKEKVKEIENILGSNDGNNIVSTYENKLIELNLDKKIHNKILREIKKLKNVGDNNPELGSIKNYLDWVLDLPWNKTSKEKLNVKSVINSLNKSHYGLDKVKERIEDYVSIKNINPDLSSPIICLVGPPGVGKTTISYSIANALNREFYKISVGGLKDATELLGTRRSYVGALPGKIIQGLKKCEVNNPVILIDEVDKMGHDYKSDPASALLDILDSTQNKTFVDNYIEEPFDLSNVLFILTANNMEDIPYVIRDRLDIIEISSYTIFEKVDIAQKYLIPKIIDDFKITKKVTFKSDTLKYIIDNYTFESGVRNLTRVLKIILTKAITQKESLNISISNVKKYLENTNVKINKRKIDSSGIVNGLAYTPNGGRVLQVECSIYSGLDEIIVTGSLGDILKESINVAISYIKEKEYISSTMFYNKVIHIHLIDGAVKKEGPSCGISITTAILSKLLNIVIDDNIAFTGEIDLKGRILRVGGIKEKVIAAFNDGIKTIYIPEENKDDLFMVPKEILDNLDIKFVNNYSAIYDDIFKNNVNKN